MKNQLEQRILIDTFQIGEPRSIPYLARGESRHSNRPLKLRKIKQITILVLAAVFIIYRIFFATDNFDCFVDRTHQITEYLNTLANQNAIFYNIISIVSQEAIEVEVILMVAIAIMRMQNLRIHMFVGAFYGLRALFLNIQKLPYPQGIVSYEPVFPNFSVPYGITRDFYYSGHTGIMLFSVLFWRRLKYSKMEKASRFLMVIVVLVLLVTRVHYIIDIAGGIIFTFWIEKYVLAELKYFDYIFTCVYRGFAEIWKFTGIGER